MHLLKGESLAKREPTFWPCWGAGILNNYHIHVFSEKRPDEVPRIEGGTLQCFCKSYCRPIPSVVAWVLKPRAPKPLKQHFLPSTCPPFQQDDFLRNLHVEIHEQEACACKQCNLDVKQAYSPVAGEGG